MSETNNIFHGSSRFIEGKLIPHKGRNPLGEKEFNQFAVYATPHFLTAIVYSLSIGRAKLFRKKHVLIAYSEQQIKVKMVGCYWTKQAGYVYTIPADTFKALNAYEWVSHSEVEILQTLVIEPKTIDELIAQKRIILECEPEPQNRCYRALIQWEEKIIKRTSAMWHAYWKKRCKNG